MRWNRLKKGEKIEKEFLEICQKKEVSIMKTKIDPHLNLFYSYAFGNDNSIEKTKQLEDNVTRSFLITLSNLSKNTQLKFINNLTNSHFKLKENELIYYDLQNLTNKKDKKIINKAKKILLIISREKKQIDKTIFNKSFDKSSKKILKQIENNKELGKILKKQYIKNKKTGNNGEIIDNDISLKAEEIDSYYTLIHGSRSDGWIFSNKFALLIESKIGNNSHCEYQLFRHLTDSNGFGINIKEILKGVKCNKYSLLPTTWNKINSILLEIDGDNNFVKEFRRYLIMIGEVLDLSFIITENLGYEHETMKKQFPLLLEKLDTKVNALGIENFGRGKKSLSTPIWDYYSFKDKKGKYNTDPHYTVLFSENYAKIYLTTLNTKQMSKILKNEIFKKYLISLLENNKELLERYYIELNTYRLVDKKKGQILGENFDTFKFGIIFSEFSKKIKIDEILKDMEKYSELAKQFEFGIIINYPTIEKIKKDSRIRKANFELLNNPDKLVELFYNFIINTQEFINIIKD